MELFILSSLEKVFSDEKPTANPLTHLSMLKNERSSFQIAFCGNGNKIKLSLIGKASEFAKLYTVNDVPVGNAAFDDADDFYIKKTSGMYPDYLLETDGEIQTENGKWQSVWVELDPDSAFTGKSQIRIAADDCEAELEVDVIDALLPEQKLVYTNWYHSDCLCNYYGFEAMSDEFWQTNEKFIKTAVEHGMNCILTPIFTPPLDTRIGGERRTVQLVGIKKSGGRYNFDFTNLKKWIDMCKRCGIEYFEMSHLFTQWGAKHAPKIVAADRKGREKKIFGWSTRTSSKKYDAFLRQFAVKLTEFLEKENVSEKCFFHVSDEPSMIDLKTYKKRAALINEIFSGFRVIDALSDFEFYEKGAVKLPIPCENDVEDFAGKVPELWTYYCCGQGKENVPNRFMSMPSQRSRILGMLLYKYNVKGFLQWGYNFYNTQYSIKAINPYKVTDAGGAFPSGDSFVVYPGENGETVASLRLKVFYDAIQDLRALELLESKIGREKTLALLENGTQITFKDYPQNAEWLLETRERINKVIKEN